jgi:hypothetical protein
MGTVATTPLPASVAASPPSRSVLVHQTWGQTSTIASGDATLLHPLLQQLLQRRSSFRLPLLRDMLDQCLHRALDQPSHNCAGISTARAGHADRLSQGCGLDRIGQQQHALRLRSPRCLDLRERILNGGFNRSDLPRLQRGGDQVWCPSKGRYHKSPIGGSPWLPMNWSLVAQTNVGGRACHCTGGNSIPASCSSPRGSWQSPHEKSTNSSSNPGQTWPTNWPPIICPPLARPQNATVPRSGFRTHATAFRQQRTAV